MKKRVAREIAPRLVSGECRVGIGHGLPPAVKAGLIDIANRENRSRSWVLEQVIIDYFGLSRPRYRASKKQRSNGRVKA